MQKILYYLSIYKKKILISITSVFLVLCLLSFILINNKYNAETIDGKDLNSLIIKVDVKGAVMNPGVYEVNISDRVIDAIEKAGGFSENAYQMNINLAKKLKDEAVIIVNTIDEVDYYKLSKVPIVCENASKLELNGICELYNIAELEYENTSSNSSSSMNTFVNINTATIEELTSLEGIGEGKAIKIIEYRNNNNGFSSIDQLMNVDGIGEKLYEAIKDNITV